MELNALDRIDFGIIRILQKNAWTPNKQIAAAVRLAPSTCQERIRQLRASGLIRGAHAEINSRGIGVTLEALAFIKLGRYERAIIDQFMDDMKAIPEVRAVFLVNGLRCHPSRSGKGRGPSPQPRTRPNHESARGGEHRDFHCVRQQVRERVADPSRRLAREGIWKEEAFRARRTRAPTPALKLCEETRVYSRGPEQKTGSA